MWLSITSHNFPKNNRFLASDWLEMLCYFHGLKKHFWQAISCGIKISILQWNFDEYQPRLTSSERGEWMDDIIEENMHEKILPTCWMHHVSVHATHTGAKTATLGLFICSDRPYPITTSLNRGSLIHNNNDIHLNCRQMNWWPCNVCTGPQLEWHQQLGWRVWLKSFPEQVVGFELSSSA